MFSKIQFLFYYIVNLASMKLFVVLVVTVNSSSSYFTELFKVCFVNFVHMVSGRFQPYNFCI